MTEVQGLTVDQRETLDRDGIVRLSGAVPRADAAAMADAIWRWLATLHGFDRERRETWTKERPAQLGPLAKSGAFRAMASPRVRSVIDDLLGRGAWQEPAYWGIALACFPTPEARWDVPHASWHLDAPATAPPPPVARVFVLLDQLEPAGGGTVYVSGSHRLAERLVRKGGALASAEVKSLLARRSPWLADLMSGGGGGDRIARFMEEGVGVDDVPLRVGEMTGEAGDVYLMHPLMLHTGAPNVRERPRLAVTQWIYGKGYSAL